MRSDPLTCPRCNGGRHPDRQDSGSLRGLPADRWSWSVRRVCTGLVPMQTIAPTTAGVLWKKEEGNVVSVRPSARTLRGSGLTSLSAPEDTSFARSRDPCTSIGTTLAAIGASRNAPRCRVGRDIAVGQTCASRRNRRRGHDRTDDCAARRVSPLEGATRRGRA